MQNILYHHYTQDVNLEAQNRIIEIDESKNLVNQIDSLIQKYKSLSEFLSFEIDINLLEECLSANIYKENIGLFIDINSLEDIKNIKKFEEKIKDIYVTFELKVKNEEILKAVKELVSFEKVINISFDRLKSMDTKEYNKLLQYLLIKPQLLTQLFPFAGIAQNFFENDSFDVDFWLLSDEVLDDALYIDKDGKVSLSKRFAQKGEFFADSLNILKIKSSSFYKSLSTYLKEEKQKCKDCSIFSMCKGYMLFEDEKFDCSSFVDGIEFFKESLTLFKEEQKQIQEAPTYIPTFQESKKAIFSIPFFTGMEEEFFYKEFLPFLDKYHEYIYDIYFTYITPPFLNDAMGCADMANHDGEGVEAQNQRIFSAMMQIQQKYGIKTSATFNNTNVDPTEENLELFIKNLKPLYQAGLRSMTIPHYLWMLNGKLRKEFPDMTIKNTILKKVSKPQEYVDYVKAGFDVVNIDRYNLRDRDNLKRLKKAYEHYKVPMVILANEWCRGLCPAMSEHYHYNNSSSPACSKLYFDTTLGHLTCPTWQTQEAWYNLKNANMPITRKEVDELLEYVQIFKMHGRNDFGLMQQSMDIIRRYADGEEIVFKELYDFMMYHKYDKKKIEFWSNYTKNCKFECWNCKVCEELHKSGEEARQKSGEMVF